MNEEEKKMRDNIALVAMQSLMNRKPSLTLWQRVLRFVKGYEYYDDPDELAETAYAYAQSMMDERTKIIKQENEL